MAHSLRPCCRCTAVVRSHSFKLPSLTPLHCCTPLCPLYRCMKPTTTRAPTIVEALLPLHETRCLSHHCVQIFEDCSSTLYHQTPDVNCACAQILTDETIKGIKWKPGKLKIFWEENLRICWTFMRERKIQLGGVNFICESRLVPDCMIR